MNDLLFITGNQNKADYLAKWLGLPVAHRKLELTEIQSLDSREVAEHKARIAYELVRQPVLVEDVALTFHGMGRLPGTLIKWFLEEIGMAGLCKLGQTLDDKTAAASITYCLFDGASPVFFEATVEGSIAPEVRSMAGSEWKTSLSWNSIFIPSGSTKTYGEMTDEELEPFSHRAAAIAKLRDYLTKN